MKEITVLFIGSNDNEAKALQITLGHRSSSTYSFTVRYRPTLEDGLDCIPELKEEAQENRTPLTLLVMVDEKAIEQELGDFISQFKKDYTYPLILYFPEMDSNKAATLPNTTGAYSVLYGKILNESNIKTAVLAALKESER